MMEHTINLVREGSADLSRFIMRGFAPDDLVDTGLDTRINHNDTAVNAIHL